MTTKPKLSNFMNAVLRKSKPVLDPKSQKDTLLHDGSKESEKILRSFIPYLMNKDRQYSNNIRAAYATHMGVWKKPHESTEKGTSMSPLLKKARKKKEEDLVEDLLSEEGLGEETMADDDVPPDDGETTESEETSDNKDETEPEQEIGEIFNKKRLGGVISPETKEDRAMFRTFEDLLTGYVAAVRRYYGSQKPGQNSEQYAKQVDELQDLVAERMMEGILPFLIDNQSAFLGDLNLMEELGKVFTGSQRQRANSMEFFGKLIDSVKEQLEEDQGLRSFGNDVVSDRRLDYQKDYDIKKDFKSNIDKKKILTAIKRAFFIEPGKDYGEIDHNLHQRIKTNIKAMAEKPGVDTSITGFNLIKDFLTNACVTIPANIVNCLNTLEEDKEEKMANAKSSAEINEINSQYNMLKNVSDLYKELLGHEGEDELDFRENFKNKNIPAINKALLRETKINSSIIKGFDPDDLKSLGDIVERGIKSPKSFTNGSFMNEFLEEVGLIADSNTKSSNWFTSKDQAEFTSQIFDLLYYFAHDVYPGNKGDIFNSMDRYVSKEEDKSNNQMSDDPELLPKIKNNRMLLKFLDGLQSNPKNSEDDIYKAYSKHKKYLKNKPYDTEKLQADATAFGVEIDGNLGKSDLFSEKSNERTSGILSDIGKLNDFFDITTDGTGQDLINPYEFNKRKFSVIDSQDENALDRFLDNYEKNTIKPLKEKKEKINTTANRMGIDKDELLGNLYENGGFSLDALNIMKVGDLATVLNDAATAYEISQENPDILGDKHWAKINKKDLDSRKKAHDDEIKTDKKNAKKDLEFLNNKISQLSVTEEDLKNWKKDPILAEEFMREVIGLHFGVNKIKTLFNEDPRNQNVAMAQEILDKNLFPKKAALHKLALDVGADVDGINDELMEFKDKFGSPEHREQVEKKNQQKRAFQRLNEINDLINSKIAQEIYENQSLFKDNEFFKYVEGKDGEGRLEPYRLVENKKGEIIEEKLNKKELEKRDKNYLGAIPVLSEHFGLDKKKKREMRKFAQSVKAYNSAEKGSIARGLHETRMNNLKKSISTYLPEEAISSLEGVSKMDRKEITDYLSKQINVNVKPEFRSQNSYVIDPESMEWQGIFSSSLVKTANETKNERTAHLVPDTGDDKKVAVVGGKILIGNTKETGEDLDTQAGIHPGQLISTMKNRKLKDITEAENMGNGIYSSDKIRNFYNPPDESQLSDYGQRGTPKKFSIPNVKTAKTKSFEGIGKVLGHVFKEDDESWLEVIEE